MATLLLEPHNDDVALFAAYAALAAPEAHIVTCLRSYVQEGYKRPITFSEREQESYRSAEVLGCAWTQWGHHDNLPLEILDDQLRTRIRGLINERTWERVYAPLPLIGGHDHHNIVGELAIALVPPERLTLYCTYIRGEGRTHGAMEIVPRSDWPALKYRAMSCYVSQINEPMCQPWFVASDALREWVA